MIWSWLLFLVFPPCEVWMCPVRRVGCTHRGLFWPFLTNRGSESMRYWVTTSSRVQLNRSGRFMEVQDTRVNTCSRGYSGYVLVWRNVCLYVQRGRRSLCSSGLCSRRSCCSLWVLLCLSSCTEEGAERSVCVFCMKVSVMMMMMMMMMWWG